MLRYLIGIIILSSIVTLSACGDGTNASAKAQIENLTATWNTLEDGSKFARVSDFERNREIAMRCWPQAEGSHLCLSVVKNSTIVNAITVSRRVETTLPDILWGLSGDGYRCEDLMGKREEVALGNDVLISNRLRETGQAWSSTFVRDYMTKNKVDAPGHFRCFDVLEAITEGSLRTIGTTSINRAMAS